MTRLPFYPTHRVVLPLAAAICSLPLRAQAGPPEWMAQAVIDDANPCRVTLRYINGRDGLLFSEDGGRTFRLRCSSSLDEQDRVGSNFAVSIGADGAPLVGSFAGFSEAGSDACGWALNPDPLVAARAVDFASHPSDDSRSFILMSSTTTGERTGIVQRRADGALSAVGSDDTGVDGSSDFYGARLRVVKKPEAVGGVRYYETGSRRADDDSVTSYVRYSDDGAESWTEHEVEGAGTGTVLLWAVDPNDSDGLLLSVHDPEGTSSPDLVLVSEDAGATTRAFTDGLVSDVAGAVIADDGQAWVADSGATNLPLSPHGLWHAASLSETAAKIGDEGVHCLALRRQDGSLFGCHLTDFGRLDGETAELTPLFTLHHTEGFVECPGEMLAQRCESQLCGAYCGSGPYHYPESLLCTAYSDPTCGPEAASFWDGPSEPPAPLAHVVDPLCPHPNDDVAATPDAGAADGGTDASAGPAADAGAANEDAGAADTGDGSGCNTSGRDSLPPFGALLGLLAWLGIRTPRRRRI